LEPWCWIYSNGKEGGEQQGARIERERKLEEEKKKKKEKKRVSDVKKITSKMSAKIKPLN